MYMNNNQFTQKTLEALQAAQQLAIEYQHNAVEPEHMLHALVTQQQGLIPQLLQALGADPGTFSAAVAEKLAALPRVSGSAHGRRCSPWRSRSRAGPQSSSRPPNRN